MATRSSSEPAKHGAVLLGLGWFLCSLFFFYAFVHRNAPSVMVEDLMRDFAVGGAILGNLSAFYFYAYAGSQVPVGVLIDRFGPRRMISGAVAVAALGSVVFALADQLWLANIGRLLIGFGCAFSFAGALNYAAIWLPTRHFAALGGGAQAMGVLGGIVGQAPLGVAIEHFGWRPTTLALAVAGLALALACAVVLRDKPRRATGVDDHHGLLAGLKIAAVQPQTWLCALFGFSMTSTMLTFGSLWGVPFFERAHNLSTVDAAKLASVLLIGWGIGAPLIGWISDRLQRRRLMMSIGGMLSILGFIGAVYIPSMPLVGVGIALAIQGVGSSSMVLAFALAREHNPDWASGATIGIVNCLVVGSGAIMQPLSGYLLDLGWDGAMQDGARVYSEEAFRGAFLILPAIGFTGFVTTLLMQEKDG